MPNAMFDQDLDRNAANYAALTPMGFLERAGRVHPQLPAIVHGVGPHGCSRTWGETWLRCRRLADALRSRGLGRGDTVAALLANTPEMVEAHFGVPMAGCVLSTLNTRLEVASLAYMLEHGEARVLLLDREFAEVGKSAVERLSRPLEVIMVNDRLFAGEGPQLGMDYETMLALASEDFPFTPPADEWDAIALNYTSGTTGEPKGVVYHHRGAYLNAVSNVLVWAMPQFPVYLWTLPMFHCNGWCFPWTIAAMAGVNVCLRRVEASAIFDAIRTHRVTHYCGAPIVHTMLIDAPASLRAGIDHRVHAMVAAAAPPAAMIEGMDRIGFDLTHVYGLTEVYGPAAVCAKQPDWPQLDITERAARNGRQGVRYPMQEGVTVMDPNTMTPVPADGETMGEIMFRGNVTMKGYLKQPAATAAAFAGGWFHSGDLAVTHPDGYVKIKDRSKDIIISGGENISSLEIEDVLYRHPAVAAVAVVAAPDVRWGEVPCAYVELRDGKQLDADALIAFCRTHLAGFKVPKRIVFEVLPKTSTGKIQKYELRRRARSTAAIDI